MWSKAINSWKTCVDKISFRALIPISHLDAKQRVSQNSGDAGACCFGMFYDGNMAHWYGNGNGMTQYTVWHQEVCQAGMAQWYDTIHRVVVWKASMACVLLLEAAFLIRPCLKLSSYMGQSRREKLRM